MSGNSWLLRLALGIVGLLGSSAVAQAKHDFELDPRSLAEILEAAPGEEAAARAQTVLTLPWPDGSPRSFRVWEVQLLPPQLAARFPEIRTWRGQGIEDPTASAALDLTPAGFHAQILSDQGAVYIDPRTPGEVHAYRSAWKQELRTSQSSSFRCLLGEPGFAQEEAQRLARTPARLPASAATGPLLRTYRLALAGTGEYTTRVCSPSPPGVACGLAAMTTSMNRVNGIFEREVAVRMVFVTNQDRLVYTNGNTDPYTNDDGFEMLDENQQNINATIGSGNYDVGHVFSTGGGGVARVGVPCTSLKAEGVTGSSQPTGDGFDVDYVAHEIGHQFGALHTFNGTTSSCGGGNRSPSAAFEPGSGSTIMSYAGICGAENLQAHSDAYFHIKSLDEITSFVGGRGCDAETATGNSSPLVAQPATFTIPRQTPFVLNGFATDPEGDALTYAWEEFDLGTASPPNTDNGSRPIFRSFPPTDANFRVFPRLSNLLAGTTALGESLPTTTRAMKFRLTVRDNRAGGGGVDSKLTTVNVVSTAGPFRVRQPNTNERWVGGTQKSVEWDVASTTAAPVNCANVKILVSSDGGLTFPTVVLASTPNDGAQTVTAPSLDTNDARLLVQCVGNIFFDVSDVDFRIEPGSVTPSPTGTPTQTPIPGSVPVGPTQAPILWLAVLGGLAALSLLRRKASTSV